MFVDFDIMPDIPEDKRGLDYWANPKWLSINTQHNKRIDGNYYLNHVGNRKQSLGYLKAAEKNCKPLTLIDENGVKIRYDSQSEATIALGYKNPSGAPIAGAVRKRGVKLEDGTIRIRLMGHYYRFVPEQRA